MDFITILKKLAVLQQVSNKDRNPKLGRGFMHAYKLNSFNPLSYLTIVVMLIVGLILFGIIGIKKEMDLKNPFKWN